ncbi:membrane protein [Streptomyces atrovirens]|uniref:EF-hand domain-containing protein n=1 Tax=Streptomyces atrovirens TaxID=285556 RepID=A0ABW0DVB9_9ACTN
MTHPVLALGATSDLPLLLVAVVPAALALVLTAWAVRRRGTRSQKRLGGPAVKVAAVAALGCTAYSADTSWRFAADYLDMAGTAERAGMFAAAELALFATALMARQNLAVQGAPGLPGTLVWVITTVQVIPAYAESGPVGGTVRAFVGPVMAAMLWHLAMGIELRLRTPGAASHGLLAVLGREARERLLSRLGIAARDRDAAQITRDRATARAVTLAARLAERTPEQQRNRRGRRLTRRLSKAVGRASVGTDPLQRAQLLDQLAARRHALALATVPLPSPWSPAHSTSAAMAPAQPPSNVPVPVPGPDGSDEPVRDRGPRSPRGPVPEEADPEAKVDAGTEGDGSGTAAGTKPSEDGAVPGTELAGPEAAARDAAATRTDRNTREVAAQDPDSHRGPDIAKSGTESTEDRGPTAPQSGTESTEDRGPTAPQSGTETTQDRGHKVPLRRKPTRTSRTKNKDRRARSRSPQTERQARELGEPERQLVREVRPHVPALLERDGNGAITRVQLREIIRRQGLTGVGNDRLGLVLQELRNEDITTPRSTAR